MAVHPKIHTAVLIRHIAAFPIGPNIFHLFSPTIKYDKKDARLLVKEQTEASQNGYYEAEFPQ